MTTPDGVMLAGWWLRVGARILDGIFASLLAVPFTGWFVYRYVVAILDWSRSIADQSAAGSAPIAPLPPWDALRFVLVAAILGFLVTGAYEVFFLTRSGATPGKKIVGISVRLRDRPGPLPLKAALGRTACQQGLRLVSPGDLIDGLWPLWDDRRQAIHDKVAATNVVVGPQPGRDAGRPPGTRLR